ncbi:MAG: V-type ATP synthase subunit I [Methanomassiliicoccales archaeon]
MLLPEEITKVLIVGSKEHLKDTIDILYSVECVHPIDFSAEEEGFSLGTPMPVASEISAKLLKLRALEKDMGVEREEVADKIEVSQIRKDLDSAISTLSKEISEALEKKNQLTSKLQELDSTRKQVEPFASLPLDLEMYRGYSFLVVFTGFVKSISEEDLTGKIKNFELFLSPDKRFLALFVAKEEAAEAQKLLVQNGYMEYLPPRLDGSPEKVISTLDGEIASVKAKIEEAESHIASLRERYQSFMLASDEELSIQVEKAELPLRMGATEHAFVLDGWVPTKNVLALQKALDEKVGTGCHLEVLETVPRRMHIHPEEAKPGTEKIHVVEEPPSKLSPGKTIGKFSFLTELISIPKYNELDPTNILSITFPLFFGLMVGDLAYGVAFSILGYIGLRKCRTSEWRVIATMLFFGGIWATIFGLFLFGEAFGMHFGPQWVAHGGESIEELKELYPLGNELSWSSMLGTALPQLGMLSKLHDVKIFLFATLFIGLAHLAIGFILGIYNKNKQHGLKDAFFEKMGWLMILFGLFLVLLFMVNMLIQPISWMGFPAVDLYIYIGLGLIIPGIIIAYIGEGGGAILELPALFTNVLSYSRLAAIGMSKAGMAMAFNMIAIEMLAPAGGAMLLFAIVVFMIGHLTIFMLAVISAGLHSVRLHYVELFTKFYTGGGTKFSPLRIVRKYTTER